MNKLKVVVNETVKTRIADAMANTASKDGVTPVVVALGCSRLENSEFSRLYLAACKGRETFRDELWQEPILLAEALYAAAEKERIRRRITVNEVSA